MKDKRVDVDHSGPAIEVIEHLAVAAGLEWDILHGIVILGRPERIYGAFAKHPLQETKALSRKVNFDYYNRTPVEILQDVSRRSGVAIVVAPGAAMRKAGPIMARFENVTVRNIVTFLALSYGDPVALREGGPAIGPFEPSK